MKRPEGSAKPTENHGTAAWSDARRLSRISRAPHPGPEQTANAKRYADENEK